MKLPGYTHLQAFHAGRAHQLFRAWDKKGKRSVVLKVAGQHGAGPALLEREYRILQQLESPGIIGAYDLFDHDNFCVLVLEDMDGEALTGFSLTRPEQLQDLLELSLGICVALANVHKQGVIHRNIKPTHILVNPSREIGLIDFSIASPLTSEGPELLDPEQRESSPVYLAPEQTGLFQRSVDARADIYSLGAVLYELASGDPPFRANSLMGLAIRITSDPRPLHEANPMIPPFVSSIIGHMLAREASDRYTTINGVIYDLANCLASCRSHQEIEPAEPLYARPDGSFLISEKLYGRDRELAVLRDCFTNVRLGQTELLILEGEAGIGKTALVREQRHMLLSNGSFYVEGQFERFQGDQPYSAVSQVFSALLKQLDSRRGHRWKKLKIKVAEAFGKDGPIVSQVFRLSNQLTASEEAFENMSPEVTRNRLNDALLRIIAVLADEKHPLVVFLDDLQWADEASLELLGELLSHREICHFLLIGAHREIAHPHPLGNLLKVIKQNRVAITYLKPERLSAHYLKTMLLDSLKINVEQATSLVQLLTVHAHGNPFLTRELLTYLWDRHLLCFNGENWVWHAAETAEIPIDLADLMDERLRSLPQETQDILSLGSCFIGELNLEVLSFLREESVAETAQHLFPVLQKHILVPTSPAYRLSMCHRAIRGAGLDAGFHFSHENYRKAAYNLLDIRQKQALHLKIGRALYDSWSQQEERFVELAGFFNAGSQLIDTPSERRRVARLNLVAGRKNLQAVAFIAADHHFQAGLDLLGKNPWRYGHELVFPLMLSLAESSLMFGRLEQSQALYRSLNRSARNDRQRAHIIDSRLKKYRGLVPKQAVKNGLRALRLLGLHVPGRPTRALIQKELEIARDLLASKHLKQLPIVHDPALLTLFRLLGKLPISATSQGNRRLAVLLTVKSIQLTLLHGLSPEAPSFFTGFGSILAQKFGDLDNSSTLINYALELIDQRAYSASRGQVLYETAMGFWGLTNHWGKLTQLFHQAAEFAMKNGDLLYSIYACVHLVHWDPSTDLATSCIEEEYFLNQFAARFPVDRSPWTFYQYHLCLRGQTRGPFSLDTKDFNETRVLANARAQGMKSPLANYYLLKMQLHFIHGDFDGAYSIIEKHARLWPALVGLPWIEFRFFGFLVLVAKAHRLRGHQLRAIVRRLQSFLKVMTKLAKLCPENFEHRRLLMAAEMLALRGKDAQASQLFRDSATVAEANEYVNLIPIIHESTARFYLRRGLETGAAAFFNEAITGYSAWGATVKCKLLRKQYQFFLGLANAGSQVHDPLDEENRWPGTTTGTRSFDLGTILEANQTVSSEIEIESLWLATTRVTMKHSGAQRGCLIMQRQNGLVIEVESDEQETKRPSVPLSSELARSLVPITVVTLVGRTQKSLMLEEPAREGEFVRDPYFHVRQPTCLLCLPLIKQADLQGILVLEHFQSQAIFNRQNVAILELLTSTAAVSNENARFYAQMKQTVSERTADLDARNRELESLDTMVETINSEIEPGAVCRALLAQGAHLFPKPARAVLFLAPAERPFAPVASLGLSETELKEFVDPSGKLPRDFLENRRPWGSGLFLLKTDMNEPNFSEPEQVRLLNPTLAMELLLDKNHLGLILWEVWAEGQWQQWGQKEKLQRFANHAATAMAKALFIKDLQEKKAEIQAKGEAILKAQNRLAMTQRMATLGTLTAGIAHEINNPNNFISAGAQNLEIWCDCFGLFLNELAGDHAPAATMLEIENRLDQLKDQLTEIRQGSDRIDQIVKDLRLFTRHDEATWKRVDIIASLCATVGLVGAMFPKVAIKLQRKEAIVILCRPAELNQVFLNLAHNGCLASGSFPDGKGVSRTLSIVYRLEVDEVVILFQDNGPGIVRSDQEKIFEPFYSNWSEYQGTGLGLYNVRRIVARMGGRIEVASQPEQGACFTLHLPIRSPVGESQGLY